MGLSIAMIVILGLPCLYFGVDWGWHWYGGGCLISYPPGGQMCGPPVLLLSLFFLLSFAAICWLAYYWMD